MNRISMLFVVSLAAVSISGWIAYDKTNAVLKAEKAAHAITKTELERLKNDNRN